MGYQGRHRPGARTVDGEVVEAWPDTSIMRRELPRVGRLRLLGAWLRWRRELKALKAKTRSVALVPRDAANRPDGYVGRHERARRVVAVEVRLVRARRSDERRPVSVAVRRDPREKAATRRRPRHSAPGRASYGRVAACRHRAGVDSAVDVATILAAL